MRLRGTFALLALFSGGVLASPAQAALDWQPIVRYGDPAPGLPEGTAITGLFAPSGAIDASRLAIPAGVGPIVSIDTLYRWTPESGLALVAATGVEPLFGADVARAAVSNESGDFALLLEGPAEADPCDAGATRRPASILRELGAGGFAPIAATGDAVPGSPEGSTYQALRAVDCEGGFCRASPMMIGAGGDVAFVALVAASPCAVPTIELMAPDGIGGVERAALLEENTPTWFSFADEGIGPFGDFVFLAHTGDEDALYRKSPGESPVRLLATGEPIVPASAETWTHLLPPTVSPAGDLAFVGTTSAAAGAFVWNVAWLVRESGETEEIVRAGAPVPGGPEDATFANGRPSGRRFASVSFDEDGEPVLVWFFDTPGLPQRTGVFTRSAGGLELRLVSGDPAPGSDGAWFGGDIGVHGVASDGSILLSVDLVQPDPMLFVGDALYWLAPGRAPRLLARNGDVVELAPGAPDVVASIEFVSVDFDATPPSVVARLSGATGSGLFRATVPEPAVPLSAIAAIAALSQVGVLRIRA